MLSENIQHTSDTVMWIARDPSFTILGLFFLMIRRPPRSTLDRSSAASDVYKRQGTADHHPDRNEGHGDDDVGGAARSSEQQCGGG